MNGVNGTVVNRVTGTSTLVRPKFGPGMLLQHDDLEQLSAYTRELSRLMFRSLFGCGVVCGLEVKPEPMHGKGIVVSSGLALDCAGDPIYLPNDQPITIDEHCIPGNAQHLWVVLCSRPTCCAPRTPACASDEEESPSVCTRERDGYEIRIVSALPECACHCEPPGRGYARKNDCYANHYAGKCGCHAGEECDCSCDCVVLARLDKSREKWKVDHHVRRFVRPVLMRDPQTERSQRRETEAGYEAEERAEPAKRPRVARPKRRT